MAERTPAIRKESPLKVWQRHFSIGTASPKRYPISQLSVENGLTETRLFQLKNTEPQEQLLLIIQQQILGLVQFLNFSKNFSEAQIMDTSEIILEEFDDFSFTAIMDCLHRIKIAKHPFDKKLYESLDGRKLLDMFNIYREMQTEHLENKHLEKKASQGNVLKQFMMVSPDDLVDGKLKPEKKETIEGMKEMLRKLKFEESLKKSPKAKEWYLQDKANKGEATAQEIEELEELKAQSRQKTTSPVNEMCQEYFIEYDRLKKYEPHKIPKGITSSYDYLSFQISKIKVESTQMIPNDTLQKWATEFWELREQNKLPDGIDTYSKYFEWKTF